MNKLLLVAGIALLSGAMLYHSEKPKLSVANFVPEEYVAKFAEFKKSFNKKYGGAED
jgi:hypothetical protein